MGQRSVFVTGLTDIVLNPTSYPPDGLGTIREENSATYKFVEFTGTTAVAAGDVVSYIAYNGSTNPLNQKVDAANTAFGAGVAMAAVASGSAASGAVGYAFGWIQIRGYALLSTALGGSCVLGSALTTNGASDKALTLLDAAGESQVAICIDDSAKKVNCMFPV